MRGSTLSRRRGRTVVALASVIVLGFTSLAFALTINGTTGDDVLIGTNQADTIDARAGNDTVVARGGPDRVTGALGNDDLNGGPGSDTLDAGLGLDDLVDTAGPNSSDGPDVDKLFGRLDNDILNAADGDSLDRVDGGGFGVDFCIADTGDIVAGCEQGFQVP